MLDAGCVENWPAVRFSNPLPQFSNPANVDKCFVCVLWVWGDIFSLFLSLGACHVSCYTCIAWHSQVS